MTDLRGLDNWITGHFGADAPQDPERVVECRKCHARHYASDCNNYQCPCGGDLEVATCDFCGRVPATTTARRWFCSKACAKADAMGL